MFSLNEEGSKEIEEYEAALLQITQLIQSSGDRLSDEEVSQLIIALQEGLTKCRVQR